MLVIDDESGIRMLLARFFSRTFEVICAGTVDEGLRHLTIAAPDIILIDFNMPGKNGIQGLREIRRIDPYVSIIMITGSMLSGEANQVMKEGADAFLTKPFELPDLARLVTRLTAPGSAKSGRDEDPVFHGAASVP